MVQTEQPYKTLGERLHIPGAGKDIWGMETVIVFVFVIVFAAMVFVGHTGQPKWAAAWLDRGWSNDEISTFVEDTQEIEVLTFERDGKVVSIVGRDASGRICNLYVVIDNDVLDVSTSDCW